MDGHLVPVKVGIEGGTDQGMQTDCFALHQNRIKRLDAEPMECWGAVQKYGVLLDDLIEDVPDLRLLILD